MIPFDSRKPLDPSGIRLGTPAITTRGFDTKHSKILAQIIVRALKNHTDETFLQKLKEEVRNLCIQFPIP